MELSITAPCSVLVSQKIKVLKHIVLFENVNFIQRAGKKERNKFQMSVSWEVPASCPLFPPRCVWNSRYPQTSRADLIKTWWQAADFKAAAGIARADLNCSAKFELYDTSFLTWNVAYPISFHHS